MSSVQSIFRIVIYNIFTPVSEPLRVYGTRERSERVKDILSQIERDESVDVIVLNEVIPQFVDKTVTHDLTAMGFVHRTETLGNTLSLNGGVYIFSKYPILRQDHTVFGDHCVGTDCFAAKGCVYAEVVKGGYSYHVFGTHMQAWPQYKLQLIRERQLQHIRSFIQHQQLPTGDPWFLCGDLNIDMYSMSSHFHHVQHLLQVRAPVLHPDSHKFTYDPETDVLTGSDIPSMYSNHEYPDGCVEEYYKTLKNPCCQAEWMDYVMVGQSGLQPIMNQSYMRSMMLKVEPFEMNIRAGQRVTITDVSDHYPVLGHFVFDHRHQSRTGLADRVNAPSPQLSNNQMVGTIVGMVALVSVVLFTVVAVGLYYKYPRVTEPKQVPDFLKLDKQR
jgi:endonuclease/exonuclease/phosphatase family metal-dependent hydrolase